MLLLYPVLYVGAGDPGSSFYGCLVHILPTELFSAPKLHFTWLVGAVLYGSALSSYVV